VRCARRMRASSPKTGHTQPAVSRFEFPLPTLSRHSAQRTKSRLPYSAAREQIYAPRSF
jgi:hypothetical protein